LGVRKYEIFSKIRRILGHQKSLIFESYEFSVPLKIVAYENRRFPCSKKFIEFFERFFLGRTKPEVSWPQTLSKLRFDAQKMFRIFVSYAFEDFEKLF
jgi:hypothetical protein